MAGKYQITPISAETKLAIKRKSAFNLPDRPTEKGMRPDEIKRAFWDPLIGTDNSVISELERIIREANTVFSDIDENGTGERRTFTGEGGSIEILLQNNSIYYISGYDSVKLVSPALESYLAHLFITIPSSTKNASIECPEGIAVYGKDPATAAPGDIWEISIDNVGGAVCAVRKGR